MTNLDPLYFQGRGNNRVLGYTSRPKFYLAAHCLAFWSNNVSGAHLEIKQMSIYHPDYVVATVVRRLSMNTRGLCVHQPAPIHHGTKTKKETESQRAYDVPLTRYII